MLLGALGVVLSLAVRIDVAESLWPQMYFYAALFGPGLLLGAWALIGHQRGRWWGMIGLAINIGVLIWQYIQFYQQNEVSRAKGWL